MLQLIVTVARGSSVCSAWLASILFMGLCDCDTLDHGRVIPVNEKSHCTLKGFGKTRDLINLLKCLSFARYQCT